MADVICLSTKQVSPFLALCLPCLRKTRFGVYGQGGWHPNIHAPSIPGSLVAQDPRLVGWDFSTYSSLCSWSCTVQWSSVLQRETVLWVPFMHPEWNSAVKRNKELLCFFICSQLHLLPTSLSKPSDSRRILPLLLPIPLISSSR